jgi:hypothetical protein
MRMYVETFGTEPQNDEIMDGGRSSLEALALTSTTPTPGSPLAASGSPRVKRITTRDTTEIQDLCEDLLRAVAPVRMAEFDKETDKETNKE